MAGPIPETRARKLQRRLQIARVLVSSALALLVQTAFAADPDVDRAQQLLQEGEYQQAYELLAPFEKSSSVDAQFSYLLGRAALGARQPKKAKAMFERAIAARTDFVAAHLGLGRAYFALGRYARAKIEFETVLRFPNLPPDVLTQVEVYDRAARQVLEENKPLVVLRLCGNGHRAATG
jgi:tetratricopeptide (TPR) repeat protein